jgi:hypothetical protein
LPLSINTVSPPFQFQEGMMSHTLKLSVAVSVLGVCLVASQGLPGADQSNEKGGVRRPRGADAPVTRAIMKDEEASVEEKILNALDKPTTVEFVDLPLEDCLTFLHEYHGVNIWLDHQTLADEGVAMDAPVTLKLKNVKFESILNLILGPVQLDWVIQDEVLKITTRSSAREHPEVRTHPVQALLDAGHTPQELIESITSCIEPDSWTSGKGTAGISHSGGVLVVRGSQRVQTEIAQLLSELEDIATEEADQPDKRERDAVVSVRVYPTRQQRSEHLAITLQELIAQKTWSASGGEGMIYPLEGILVVRQTAGVHRSIQQLLAQVDRQQQSAPAAEEAAPPAAPGAAKSSDPFGVMASPPSAPPGNRNRRDLPGKNPLKR